ncbi:MAG: methyl-accepting chemotaxis protein [Pseudomonadota bacterium]|nr:methyl-accepting chemotaxis protein [Pseudomonadota bacterium]
MNPLLYPAALAGRLGRRTAITVSTLALLAGLALTVLGLMAAGLALVVLASYLTTAWLLLMQKDADALIAGCRNQARDRDYRLLDTRLTLLAPLAQSVADTLRDSERREQRLTDRLAEIAHATGELSQSSQQIALGASEQRQASAATSAAVEEMSQSIAEVARNAQASEQASAQVRDLIQEGGSRLATASDTIAGMAADAKQTTELMTQLLDQFQSVTNMTATISHIAEQTNLLALNAAIEAARAGDNGRGFAVVANEVRDLANSSHQSAASIGTNIAGVRANIEATHQQMDRLLQQARDSVADTRAVHECLEQIQTHALHMNEQVASVAHNAREQDLAVREIATQVDTTHQRIDANGRATEETDLIVQHIQGLTAAITEPTTAGGAR